MSSEVYYICFTEAERPKWYMKLLKKGFSHCFAIQPHKGKWAKYEYGHGFARVDLLDNLDHIKNSCIIVKHVREGKGRYFGFMSCVSWIKWSCGIKGFSLTPYQLYKRLSKWH